MTEDSGSGPAPDLPKRPPPFKPTTPPSLGLPKSGGSVRGLGGKFQAGGPTGTGSVRVPIAVSPCRDGAEPVLALEYDSGQGYGPFGTGWRVSVREHHPAHRQGPPSKLWTRPRGQAPAGIDAQNYRFVDLDGEGIAGILTAAASPAPGLYYKRNLGGGPFAAAEPLPAQPSLQSIAGDVQLLSLNADGRLDVASLSGPAPGFFERTRNFGWAPFATFPSLPNIDFTARGVHLLDVDGDGLTDILVAEDDVFVWYSSLSRSGYGPPNRVTQAHDEDRGAVVLTTDDYETIFLADMSGDGLSDLVRIRNGEVCYWPNLGYARFGAKIAMQSAPMFDTPDLFDPRRIRLGDIDGTGVTDIVYLSRQGAVVYFNRPVTGGRRASRSRCHSPTRWTACG